MPAPIRYIAVCTGRCSSFPTTTTTTTDSVSSNMSQASSSKQSASVDDGEIDRLLSRQANALQREVEVERILKAFKLKCVHAIIGADIPRLNFCYFSSPYDIIDVDENATPEEIKKKYKQTSLCTRLASTTPMGSLN